MSPSEILDGAADLCARGWCQRRYREKDSVCPLGAINTLATGDPEKDAADSRIAGYLARVLPGESSSPHAKVIYWNDDWNAPPERTQAEVVAKLREAAELARGEAQ